MYTSAAELSRLAKMTSALSSACALPRTTATRRAVRVRPRVRCVRWSRPPLSTGTPRRVRETMTRQVSSTGIPTSRIPTSNASDDGSALCAALATSAATMKPSGMLPPSPRKIRAGEARL